MNHYAQVALDRHRRYRPLAHALIEDPSRFFAQIGDQIQGDVTNLRDEILGPIRPDESIDHYRLRGLQALRTAEELVLADHHLFQPEPETTELDDDPILERYDRALAEINETIHHA